MKNEANYKIAAVALVLLSVIVIAILIISVNQIIENGTQPSSSQVEDKVSENPQTDEKVLETVVPTESLSPTEAVIPTIEPKENTENNSKLCIDENYEVNAVFDNFKKSHSEKIHSLY